MPRVTIKEKHAKNLMDAVNGVSDTTLGENVRISLQTAQVRGYFSLDGLIERLLATKKTPTVSTK